MTFRLGSPLFVVVAWLHSPPYRLVQYLVSTPNACWSSTEHRSTSSPLSQTRQLRLPREIKGRCFPSHRFAMIQPLCLPGFNSEAQPSTTQDAFSDVAFYSRFSGGQCASSWKDVSRPAHRFATLHLRVRLAPQLKMSPSQGRRCHSDLSCL